MAEMTTTVKAFWQAYLDQVADRSSAEARFCEAYQIGNSAAAADEGARLILEGQKTATSMLAAELTGPEAIQLQAGSLSIVLNGRGEPVCVVETIRLERKRFGEVDEVFAKAYGEWDRTLATWRRHNMAYYKPVAEALGLRADDSLALMCEWFRVVYPIRSEDFPANGPLGMSSEMNIIPDGNGE